MSGNDEDSFSLSQIDVDEEQDDELRRLLSIPPSVDVPTASPAQETTSLAGELAPEGHIILSLRSKGMHPRTDRFMNDLDTFADSLIASRSSSSDGKLIAATEVDVREFRNLYAPDCTFWTSKEGKLRKERDIWKQATVRKAKNYEINKSITEQLKRRLKKKQKRTDGADAASAGNPTAAGGLADIREEALLASAMDTSDALSTIAVAGGGRGSGSGLLRGSSTTMNTQESHLSSLSASFGTTSNKRRAIPPSLTLHDDSCYQWVKNRFHTCFRPPSTLIRFRREFLGPEYQFQNDAETNQRLLCTFLDLEKENVSATWTRCNIPHIVIGPERSITASIMSYCGSSTEAKLLFQDLKRIEYNQVVMGRNLNLPSPLRPEDSSGWDYTVEGMVLALPSVVTITRHYMDVSSRSLTLLFGPHMAHISAILINGEEIDTDILHLEDWCHERDPALPTRDPVVIRTNDCIIFCSTGREPIAPNDIELEADPPTSGAVVVRDSDLIARTKMYEQGSLEGLVLGHHFKHATEATFWSSFSLENDVPEQQHTVKIEKWRWTSHACGIKKAPIALEKMQALAIRNKWTDRHPEFVPWPLTHSHLTDQLQATVPIPAKWTFLSI